MKTFEHTRIAEKLGADSLYAASADLRALEKSPAWFRIWQQLETERKNHEQTLYKSPRNMQPVDYAEASGALNMINKFYRILDTIIDEGKDAKD